MKNWFTSLNGAITLSALTLLSEIWRGFLDAMFVFPSDIGDEAFMHVAALIYVVLFATWTWALISAALGRRRGLIAAFIINLLVWLMIPVSTLFFYCPVDCLVDAGWPFGLANTLNLLFGLLAAAALGLQLRHHRAEVVLRSGEA
jgi:ammonia channel protein AmtB